MVPTKAPASRSLLQQGLLIAGIVLVALNLRPALASVGPLIGAIRDATGLSNVALGLLTTLPLLAFGTLSTLTPLVTQRLGIEGALAGALVLIGLGTLVRALPSVALLFGGTALLSVGIAAGNVLLPALVKRDFPEHSGALTSLYSSAMGAGAAGAAGVTVPLAGALGWRAALGAWAVPAVVALAVWFPQLTGRRAMPSRRSIGASLHSLGRSALAWQVALYMGLQSVTFYVVLAWLPDLLQARGLGPAEAGWMLALAQAVGIAGSAVVPLWAARRRDQRPVVWTLAALEAAGLGGLFLPGASLAALWVSLVGFIGGGTFGLALLFLVVRTPDPETATELSGMAQSVGYLIAAVGPALVGFLHDLTGGWTVPLLLLTATMGAKALAGLQAGRPDQIRPGG
jgi:CP family cyanate transporter-like MFS transporter